MNKKRINNIFFTTMIIITITLLITAFVSNVNVVTYGKISSASAAASLSDFRIAAVGDWGCTANTNATISNILSRDPKLVLGLGDYAYRVNTTGCWFHATDQLLNKTKITLGNHDVIPFQKLRSYMFNFKLRNPFYSFNYQNVHCLVMASEFAFDVGSEQYQFVKKDLSDAASNPNVHWIIVYYHKPAYSARGGHQPNIDFRDIYHPIFQKYHVDLVLSGHNHNYQRTYPLEYNIQNSSNPIIIDRNLTNYTEPLGQIFLTVGTGGESLYGFLGMKPPYIASEYDSSYGFLDLDIINQGKTLTANFYGNDGRVLDHFTITKQLQAPL